LHFPQVFFHFEKKNPIPLEEEEKIPVSVIDFSKKKSFPFFFPSAVATLFFAYIFC